MELEPGSLALWPPTFESTRIIVSTLCHMLPQIVKEIGGTLKATRILTTLKELGICSYR